VDSQTLGEWRAYPKGDPRDPLTYAEVLSKLSAFGEPGIGIEKINRAAELLGHLETTDSIKLLGASLEKQG
jgi:hypothetical protein